MRTSGTRGSFLCLCAHTHSKDTDVGWTWSKSFYLLGMIGRHLHFSPCFAAEVEVEVPGGSKMKKKKNLQSEGRFTTGTLRNETKGQCEEMRWDDHRLSADFTAGLNTLNLRLGTFFWLIMVRERWDASWEQVCEERWEAGTGRRANTQQQYSGRRCSRCSATRLSGSDQDFVNVIKSKTWFLHNLKITGICSVHANKSWFCSEKLFTPIREMFVSMTTWENIKRIRQISKNKTCTHKI